MGSRATGQQCQHHILVPWTYNTMGGQQGGPPDSTFHGAGRKRGREDHTYAKRFPQAHPRTFAAWSEFLPLSAATPKGVRPILSFASTTAPAASRACTTPAWPATRRGRVRLSPHQSVQAATKVDLQSTSSWSWARTHSHQSHIALSMS